MLYKHDAGSLTHVTFHIPAPIEAQTITVVGEFNGWNHTATPLTRTSEGWKTTVPLPSGREYHYRYLANGHTWMNDWNADTYAPNELGGDDSVVRT